MFRFAVTWVYPMYFAPLSEVWLVFRTDIPGNYVVRYAPGLLRRPLTYPVTRGAPWRKQDLTYPGEWPAVKAVWDLPFKRWEAKISPWTRDDPMTFIVTAVPIPYEPSNQAGPFTYPYWLARQYLNVPHP